MIAATIRPPAVAGLFYPGQAGELAHAVDHLLAQATALDGPPPKALIVPHAGYVYSGPLAAAAYAQLERLRGVVTRVVLLGPAHRVAVDGLALPGGTAFASPLGDIPLDLVGCERLLRLPQVSESPLAHAAEHSLEVQLPFLQRTLDAFSLLPLVVGDASPREVSEVLDLVWGGPETLIVVSSDLSHYLSYEQARALDQSTARAILDLQDQLDYHSACGAVPIGGLMLSARRHGLTPHLLDLRNSGDTAGGKDSVVGYAAFSLTQASQ